jgi:RNase P subunit RPR2
MKKISKTEAEKQIEEFFSDIESKTPKEIKKIKKLAMSQSIKLGDKRKLFCKKCFNPYISPSIHVKNGFIKIICENCEANSRWKII